MRMQGDRQSVLFYLPMLIMPLGFFVLFATGQSMAGWAAVLAAAVASMVVLLAYLVSQPKDDRFPTGR